MKRMYKVVIVVLLVYLPLITMAAADPAMTVSQQPVDAGLNDTFTAEVTVDPAGSEIYAASYSLYFNSAILKATEQTHEDFLSQGGAETYEVVNRINNTAGRIEYGETRMGDPDVVGYATEPGVLASITFEVIGEGMSTLTLSNVNYVKPDDLTEPEPEPEDLTEPEPELDPTNDDESYEGSSHRSSGSSGHLAITTPTATSTETPTESAAPTSDDNGTIEDRDTVHVSGENGSVAAESMPAKTPTKKMPSHPTSMMPGFAATLAIMSLLAVIIILKSRGE